MGGQTPSVLEQTDRERLAAALLRQLSIGLSSYRLFPGELEQPAFKAAVRRIEKAAQDALEHGPVEAEVLGDHFELSGGVGVSDEITDRLARACYDRQAERIRVTAVPQPADLDVLYEVLSGPVEEVQQAGGPEMLLRRAGVLSVALGELAPQRVDVQELLGQREFEAYVDRWPQLADAIRLPEDVASEASPMELAKALFSRLRAVVAALPPDASPAVDLFRALQMAVASLPTDQQHLLTTMVVAQAGRDSVADGFIGTLSDTELSRLLVQVAQAEEVDPVRLAERLVARGSRGSSLIELTRSAAGSAAKEDLLQGLSSVLAPQREADAKDPAEGRIVYETVSDLLGRTLLDREQADLETLRAEFPDDEDDEAAIATAAIRDYFMQDDDLPRLEQVLANWTGAVQRALRRADAESVARLASLLVGARADAATGPPERADVFARHWLQAPYSGLLLDVIAEAKSSGTTESLVNLLRPLADAAVEGLLETLGLVTDVNDRGQLFKFLGELGPGNLEPIVRRIRGGDWERVRDAVAVLHRCGGPDAARLLEEASHHQVADVRREAVRGLIAVGGTAAVSRLRELALDQDEGVRTLAVNGLGGLVTVEAVAALAGVVETADDPLVRRTALEHIGRHPGPEAAQALERIWRMRGRGVPRSLRRLARRLLRARRGRR